MRPGMFSQKQEKPVDLLFLGATEPGDILVNHIKNYIKDNTPSAASETLSGRAIITTEHGKAMLDVMDYNKPENNRILSQLKRAEAVIILVDFSKDPQQLPDLLSEIGRYGNNIDNNSISIIGYTVTHLTKSILDGKSRR